MNAIKCINITKKYAVYPSPRSYLKELFTFKKRSYHKDFIALENISFEVPKGQTLGIIGRNGAGKSTLLKILAGTTKASEGELSVEGKISALLELGAGFHPEFSGRRNILLNGTILGYSAQEMRDRFDDIVSFSELAKYIDMPIKTYSSGMVVRLGFAIAIHTDPDILLIDEVLAVGDISFQKKCIRKLNEFRRAGKTILLVSHSLGDLGGFCDRVVLISGGTIQYDGDTEKVIRKYLEDAERNSNSALPRKTEDILGMEETKFDRRSGEMTITDVTIADETGTPVTSLHTGDKLQIIISYDVQEPVMNPLFRIGFYRADGLFVHGTNNLRQELQLGEVTNSGKLAVLYDHFNLLQGEYYITVEITGKEYSSLYAGSTIDCHHLKYLLRITSSRHHGGGMVYNPNRWVLLDPDKEAPNLFRKPD